MATVRREINQNTKRRLDHALKNLDGKQGRVGWFESSKYPDGTPVALVAAVHEFGWPEHNIPPRLGMREVAKEKNGWRASLESGSKAILAGNETIDSVFEKVGLEAVGDISKHISQVSSPPLKPATVIARAAGKKGLSAWSIKPLIASGLLFSSLTNDVVEAGHE